MRNIGGCAEVPTVCHTADSEVDREAAERQSRYAAEVWPRLQHEAKVRYFAIFGIKYPFKEE